MALSEEIASSRRFKLSSVMDVITNAQLDKLLSRVRRPSRYINHEVNAAAGPWDSAKLRWCLIFPDTYEIGMSHIGIEVIYHILNSEDGVLADRCFTPWTDMEAAMREDKIPLWGLESRMPISEFDIIGITLPYELTYTNILTMLDLAGIPFYAKDRGDEYPLIIGGGVGAFNPEPVAEFFDAIVLGDGEAVVVEISEAVGAALRGRPNSVGEPLCGLPKFREGMEPLPYYKSELLEILANIRGVYVPSFLSPPLKKGGEGGFKKAIISDLNTAKSPTRPIVPFTQVVHDRVGVEIQRGCARGCRFCQAGFIYRPVRQRAPEKVEALANKGLACTGNEDLSFLSLSAGDYECLPEVIKNVADKNIERWINISLPSLRVETLTPKVLDVLKRSLHGGFTLAPEAATERLRNVINKGNTEAELLATIDKIFATGWRQLKLYFMIGLPTETLEDVEAIVPLANKAMDIGRRYRRDVTITVSVSTFVPKPHTPFQWVRQISLKETIERQDILKNRLRRRGIELKWHNPQLSILEGVFSRGDRGLSPVIVEAWKNGARFDAWDESFKFAAWQRAFETCNPETWNLKFETYLAERPLDAPLPWEHLFVELDRDFLRSEYEKAFEAVATPDCVNGKCSKCGVCDFKEVKNVLYSPPLKKGGEGGFKENAPPINPPLPPFTKGGDTLSFTYSKTGIMRWLSHLELMQLFRRAFRRAGLPAKYSQGFHPHMKLSLERALKVGEEGVGLKGTVELCHPRESGDLVKSTGCPITTSGMTIEIGNINSQLPEGVEISE